MADLNKHFDQCPLNDRLYRWTFVVGVLAAQIFAHKQHVQHFGVDDGVVGWVDTARHREQHHRRLQVYTPHWQWGRFISAIR